MRRHVGSTSRLFRRVLAAWFFTVGISWLQGALLELPATPPDPVQVARLSRTLNLLRSATPQDQKTVRIIFFGQSITLQPWWRNVTNRLAVAYPHARLEVRNQAISGFAAEYLSQTVDTHVAAFRPDLVILHDYGYEKEMMDLVGRLATRTYADILLQTDHIHLLSDLNEPTDPAQLTTPTTWAQRNYVVLPRVAERYGACLADIRDRWRDYLRQHNLSPAALLADSVHPNADGNALLAALTWRYLSPETPVPASDPDNEPRVRTLVVGRDLHWQTGVLSVQFTGQDVEVVTDSAGSQVRVLVDQATPSTLPSLYEHTSASPTHEKSDWPAVLEIDAAAPLVSEDWELTVTEVGAHPWDFQFQVSGSVTGFDGAGGSHGDFRSNSGRVLFRQIAHALPVAVFWTTVPIPVGFKVRWSSRTTGVNSFTPEVPGDDGALPAFRVARGLQAGPHQLDLVSPASEGGGVRLVRIYSLTREASAIPVEHRPRLRLQLSPQAADDRLELSWPTNYPALWPFHLAGLPAASNWMAVPGELHSTNGFFSLHWPVAESAGLFQLRPRQIPATSAQFEHTPASPLPAR